MKEKILNYNMISLNGKCNVHISKKNQVTLWQGVLMIQLWLFMKQNLDTKVKHKQLSKNLVKPWA